MHFRFRPHDLIDMPDETKSSTEECLNIMKTFMETMTNNLKESFERSFNALQAEIFELRKVIKQETFARQQIEEDYRDLKEDYIRLNEKVEQLLEREDEAEMEKKKLDIVIDNVPAERVSGQDRHKHLCKVVNNVLMGQVIQDSDVVKVSHFNNKNNPNKMTIIATLKKEEDKTAILKQKKMFLQKKLFLKENLTKKRYQLLKATREKAKRLSFKFVWVRGGKIYLRKTDESSALWIRRRSQLDRLEWA